MKVMVMINTYTLCNLAVCGLCVSVCLMLFCVKGEDVSMGIWLSAVKPNYIDVRTVTVACC